MAQIAHPNGRDLDYGLEKPILQAPKAVGRHAATWAGWLKRSSIVRRRRGAFAFKAFATAHRATGLALDGAVPFAGRRNPDRGNERRLSADRGVAR